jgi:hypothetical protein
MKPELTTEQHGELLTLVTREMGVLQDTHALVARQPHSTLTAREHQALMDALDKRLTFLTDLRQALVRELSERED